MQGVRYMLYALTAAVGLAGYFVLDEAWTPSDDPIASSAVGGSRGRLTLPALTSVAGADNPAVARDLFNVVPRAAPEPAPVVAVAPAPAPLLAAPPPDRLSQLNVIGVVSHGPDLAVLVELGDEVQTVVAGQRFGADAALRIDGLDDNRVQVTDQLANISRTFTLSEE